MKQGNMDLREQSENNADDANNRNTNIDENKNETNVSSIVKNSETRFYRVKNGYIRK